MRYGDTMENYCNVLIPSTQDTRDQWELDIHHFLTLNLFVAQYNRSLSDCNWTGTCNYLVHKWILNHLANHLSRASLAKWLSVHLQTKWLWVQKSSCSHLNFRFCTCFEQGVPSHSGNYRVWIHSETRKWHDNMQSQ